MKTLIVIVGPTAVGKTALSVKLAQYFDTEVISADSRQIYQQLDIGTAKPTKDEMENIPHHFIDELPVEEEYSVGRFESDAQQRLAEVFSRHQVVILCGGSGLYVQAVTEGLDDMPSIDPEIRQQLNRRCEDEGIENLQRELAQVDPVYFKEVDRKNPQRLIRALEVYHSTGLPFSSFRIKKKKTRGFDMIKVGLELPRQELYSRIDHRVDEMLKAGLREEVASLVAKRHFNALQTVGYQEIFGYLQGVYEWHEAVRLLKRNTRRYAKRQLTWFKRDNEVEWFSPCDPEMIISYLREEVRIRSENQKGGSGSM